MKSIYVRLGMALAILMIAQLSTFGQDADQSELPVEELLQQAQRVDNDADRYALVLMSILRDDKQPRGYRLRAARQLGDMQYLPAIPLLIQYVELMPRVISEPIEPPCASALSRYGEAAVPQIVRAFAGEGNDFGDRTGTRKFGLAHAIKLGNTFSTARTYGIGLAEETTDPGEKKNIEELLKTLRTLEESEKRRTAR